MEAQTYIVERLAALERQEEETKARLCEVASAIIDRLSVPIETPSGAFAKNTELLTNELSEIADLTGGLSRKVRLLDRVLRNAGRTRNFVNNLASAKEQMEELEKAMESGNLAKAAKIVGIFREMQSEGSMEILEENFKSKVNVLEQEVIKSVKTQFELAIGKSDNSQVKQLASLFHPLGLQGEAVNRYVSFARHKFAEACAPLVRTAETTEHAVVENLTKIFLHVADIVQEHQEHLEQEFGEDNFLAFLEGIKIEAERQTKAMIDIIIRRLASEKTKNLSFFDGVLEECALAIQRIEKFQVYMQRIGNKAGNYQQDLVGLYISSERQFLLASIGEACVDDAIDTGDVGNPSTVVEDAFFVAQKSVSRAIKSEDPNIACAVANHVVDCLSNDLKLGLEAASNEAKITFANFCNNARAVMTALNDPQELFADVKKKKLSSSDSFVHAVTNVAQAAKYSGNLKTGLVEVFNEQFSDSNFRQMFSHCLLGLDILKSELEELHGNLCKLLLHFFKPAFLSPALMNLEKLNYDMSETEFNEAQVNDPYVRAFLAGATIASSFIKKYCLPVTVDTVIFILVDQLTNRLEKLVLQSDKLRFSAFGALQFENEVRSMVTFFSQQTDRSVRSKFAKLTDIACVLNLESVDEFVTLYGARGKLRLTAQEIKSVLLLRLDFSKTTIDLVFK